MVFKKCFVTLLFVSSVVYPSCVDAADKRYKDLSDQEREAENKRRATEFRRECQEKKQRKSSGSNSPIGTDPTSPFSLPGLSQTKMPHTVDRGQSSSPMFLPPQANQKTAEDDTDTLPKGIDLRSETIPVSETYFDRPPHEHRRAVSMGDLSTKHLSGFASPPGEELAWTILGNSGESGQSSPKENELDSASSSTQQEQHEDELESSVSSTGTIVDTASLELLDAAEQINTGDQESSKKSVKVRFIEPRRNRRADHAGALLDQHEVSAVEDVSLKDSSGLTSPVSPRLSASNSEEGKRQPAAVDAPVSAFLLSMRQEGLGLDGQNSEGQSEQGARLSSPRSGVPEVDSGLALHGTSPFFPPSVNSLSPASSSAASSLASSSPLLPPAVPRTSSPSPLPSSSVNSASSSSSSSAASSSASSSSSSSSVRASLQRRDSIVASTLLLDVASNEQNTSQAGSGSGGHVSDRCAAAEEQAAVGDGDSVEAKGTSSRYRYARNAMHLGVLAGSGAMVWKVVSQSPLPSEYPWVRMAGALLSTGVGVAGINRMLISGYEEPVQKPVPSSQTERVDGGNRVVRQGRLIARRKNLSIAAGVFACGAAGLAIADYLVNNGAGGAQEVQKVYSGAVKSLFERSGGSHTVRTFACAAGLYSAACVAVALDVQDKILQTF